MHNALHQTKSGASTSVIVASSLISTCRLGPAVSLNGSPTVSPTTAALCASERLAAVLAGLDKLLRVVPCAAAVVHQHGQQHAGDRPHHQQARNSFRARPGSPQLPLSQAPPVPLLRSQDRRPPPPSRAVARAEVRKISPTATGRPTASTPWNNHLLQRRTRDDRDATCRNPAWTCPP